MLWGNPKESPEKPWLKTTQSLSVSNSLECVLILNIYKTFQSEHHPPRHPTWQILDIILQYIQP